MTPEQALFCLHDRLPRNAPGSERSTLAALRKLGRLPPGLRVVDLGCGSGSSTLTLARKLRTPVVAVDAYAPFLESLVERARAEGLAEWIEPRHADFSKLEGLEASFDLLWSEGAAFALGFERALELWRPLLVTGGWAALTELSWVVPEPVEPALGYWSRAYPKMQTQEQNCEAARRVGFDVLETFALPEKDWKNYYGPLRQRIKSLRHQDTVPELLGAVLDEAEKEIDVFRHHISQFGYIFYLLRRRDQSDRASAAGVADALRTELSLTEPPPFDPTVAAVDRQAHAKLEKRFCEAAADIGLGRAERLLQEMGARVRDLSAR